MLQFLIASSLFVGGGPSADSEWVQPIGERLSATLQDQEAEPDEEPKPVSAVPA